jgi:hypothetical protein
VIAKRPLFLRADTQERAARLFIQRIGLEFDADAPELFEGVP